MSNGYIERLDSETRDVINYLKNHSDICDLKIDEVMAATQSQINEWEIKNLCSMPADMKAFYLMHNGIRIEWNFSIDAEQSIPMGKININPLRDLSRVNTALHKNLNDPSLYDLEDIQVPPPKQKASKLTSKSNSTFSATSLLSLGTDVSQISLTKPKGILDNDNEIAEILKKNATRTDTADTAHGESESYDSDNEDVNEYYDMADLGNLLPHFGETSNNFELDNCNGYGKVCLVYKARRSDCIDSVRTQNIKEQTTEIWFLDRSLQWNYLSDSFENYYRLLISHLGLPQWQLLFTEDGLPPFLYQWYYTLAPGRILIHDNDWQRLQFLNMFENNNQVNNIKGKNQPVVKPAPVASMKIDFARLFDDKTQKNKSQNKTPPTNQQTNNTNGNNKQTPPLASIKPKSRNSLKK